MAAGDIIENSMSAQTVYYLPYGGSSRTIDAVVDYLGPQPMNGLRGGSRPHFDITVRNDSTSGISSKEIDTGKDKLQIAMRYGRSVKTVRLVEIINQDKAMMRLRAW